VSRGVLRAGPADLRYALLRSVEELAEAITR
jgi:hypothetical protein